MGIGGRPPWAVSGPDLDVGAWTWVQTRINRPALSVEAGTKASVGMVAPVCVFFSLAG